MTETHKITDELFQIFTNRAGDITVEIIYNDSHDYFYFNIFKNGELIIGDTTIVNEYENSYLRFSSLNADYATFALVTQFSMEFLNE